MPATNAGSIRRTTWNDSIDNNSQGLAKIHRTQPIESVSSFILSCCPCDRCHTDYLAVVLCTKFLIIGTIIVIDIPTLCHSIKNRLQKSLIIKTIIQWQSRDRLIPQIILGHSSIHPFIHFTIPSVTFLSNTFRLHYLKDN